MSLRPVLGALLAAVLVVGCTGGDGDQDPTAAPTSTAPSSTTASETTNSPTPSPSPTDDDATVAFGTGTVTLDGAELPVSGDCDVSREFGEEPVEGLDDDVDVLLAVDNVTGDGVANGPFALRVRLLGSGAVAGRTITSEGADAGDGTTADVTYEGTVEVAELRDRRELEFLDVAVLHLEASQDRVSGDAGSPSRDLVVDVTCPISRPTPP